MTLLIILFFTAIVVVAITLLLPLQWFLVKKKVLHYFFHLLISIVVVFFAMFIYRMYGLNKMEKFIVGENSYVLGNVIQEAGWILITRQSIRGSVIFILIGSLIWLFYVWPAAKKTRRGL